MSSMKKTFVKMRGSGNKLGIYDIHKRLTSVGEGGITCIKCNNAKKNWTCNFKLLTDDIYRQSIIANSGQKGRKSTGLDAIGLGKTRLRWREHQWKMKF